jgi:hypothetical protein
MEESVSKLLTNKVITDFVKNSQIIKKSMKAIGLLNRYLFIICIKASLDPDTSVLSLNSFSIKN